MQEAGCLKKYIHKHYAVVNNEKIGKYFHNCIGARTRADLY